MAKKAVKKAVVDSITVTTCQLVRETVMWPDAVSPDMTLGQICFDDIDGADLSVQLEDHFTIDEDLSERIRALKSSNTVADIVEIVKEAKGR